MVALLLLGDAARAGRASAAAPHEEWRTIATAHFRVHYHEGEARIAQRAAVIGEEALVELAAILGHFPEDPIHLVLTDDTDGANGFAQVLPYNLVVLFAAVPTPASALSDHDDDLRLLLIHELAHIVHLDAIRGVPWLINRVLGKVLSPNQIQPRWFIEGLATWLESRLGDAGRIRSSYFDLILRAQVLEDRLPSIDEISTGTRDFPGGHQPYLHGGRFLDFIARRHGEQAIRDISIAYGGRLVPYGLNLVAEEVTGETFVELWAAWLEEEKARAAALLLPVLREGVEEGLPIRYPAVSLRDARFGPAGQLAFVADRRDGDHALVVARGLEVRGSSVALLDPVALRSSSGDGAFTRDGRFVAVVDDVFERSYRFQDLEIIDLAGGGRRRRTEGARLSSPDVSPDGREIVAVAQGRNLTWLVTLSVDGSDDPVVLVPPRIGHQVAHPRWSPRGDRLVWSETRDAGDRAIVLFDRARGSRRDLVRSRALAESPEWAPDGEGVVFSSDRGGIYDLYRVDLESLALARLTNVRTGALDPAIDPKARWLVFSLGNADGFELRALPLDRAVERAPRAPRPTVATATASPARLSSEPYSAWETLIPKAYLLTLGFSRFGSSLGLVIEGSDAIDRHQYRLNLSVDPELARLGYSFGYTNRALPAPIGLSSSLFTTRSEGTFAPDHGPAPQETSIWSLRLGLDLPFSAWDLGHGFGVSYGVEVRRALLAPPADPFQLAPRGGRGLTLASVSLSWRFSTARGDTDSVGSARGIAFDTAVRIHHPGLGSDLEVIEVTSRLAGYLPMPWARTHVLAARLSGGVSAGNAGDRSVYTLGGLEIRNVVLDAIDGINVSADALRGYPPGHLRGPSFYLGTLEYRAPLWVVERGFETFPVFVDRLAFALFADAGDTPSGAPRLAGIHAGVGAELRLEVIMGYFIGFNVRIGYAFGLSEGGEHDPYLVLGGTY
ncbi:MAG: PD40 domain-containing protein [Deltaproteobacteria bacterium]|nr:PD40 domain-containing protein [Deltaproteobacteria bacterium]